MSNFITKVVSNIKGQIHLNLESPYVFVYGDNGSGKSAIIHSVELACFGGVYDAAGRDIKSKARLNILSPDSEVLYAEVTLNDGEVLSSSDKKPAYFSFQPAMSIAMDALTGSTNSLIRFLVESLGDLGGDSHVDYSRWDQYRDSHSSDTIALLELDKATRKALTKHRATIRELGGALKYVDGSSADSLRELKSNTEKMVLKTKAIQSSIESAMLKLVIDNKSYFEDQMSRYLPSVLGPAVLHYEDKQLRLGLEAPQTVPSGAEVVALAVALGAAFVPGPSLFILPDRAYDPVMLGNICRVLRTIPDATVWVQSPILPTGYDLESLGWQVVYPTS